MNNRFGFSLIELLVCFALLACLITATSFYFFQNTEKQLDLFLAKLQHSFYLAKTQALAQNKTLTFCPSADGLNCQDDWNRGFLVLKEKAPLFYTPGIPNHRIHCKNVYGHARIKINGFGKPIHPPGTRFVCSTNKKKIQVIIARTGRMRREKTL